MNKQPSFLDSLTAAAPVSRIKFCTTMDKHLKKRAQIMARTLDTDLAHYIEEALAQRLGRDEAMLAQVRKVQRDI